MFFFPGVVIAILTFPGVMVHEAAHRLFCDLTHVPVHNVCYFRIGNPSAYVFHGPAENLGASFLRSSGLFDPRGGFDAD